MPPAAQRMKVVQILATWALHVATAAAQDISDACGSIRITHVSQAIPCATAGSIIIDTEVSGTLELNSLVEVSDIVMYYNTGLVKLSSTSLSIVTVELWFQGDSSLQEIRLPNLTSVPNFGVQDAPKLDRIILGGEALATVDYVSVVNTSVSSIYVHTDSAAGFYITNNTNLNGFDSAVRSIDDTTFQFNGDELYLSFPDLVSAKALYIGQAGEIDLSSLVSVNSSLLLEYNNLEAFDRRRDPLRLPRLEAVGGNLSFVNNTDVVDLSFPKLKTVGGSLTIVNNPETVELSFPILNKVGGNLKVANNIGITELEAFPELSEVSEKVVLTGVFKYVELPSLSDAAGGLEVTSSENISYSCGVLETTFQSERPHQGFECRGAHSGTGPEVTDPGQEGEETSPAQPLSGGVIAGIVVGALAAVGILAAVLFIVWKRRRKGAAVEEGTLTTGAGDLQDPKYTVVPPDELQGVPLSEIASPDPELEGSRVPKREDTIYYEVDGTARRAA